MMRRIRDMEQCEEEKDRSTSTEKPASTQSRKNKNLRLAAIYRAEYWTLNEDIVKRLVTFERKVLRRMCGRIEVNEIGENYIIKN